MSSLRLYAPPCWDCASMSSLASRWAMVFSRRWRGQSASSRAAGLGGAAGGGAAGPLGHGLHAARAGELDEPADGERARAAGRDLDWHLIGGAADAAGADL